MSEKKEIDEIEEIDNRDREIDHNSIQLKGTDERERKKDLKDLKENELKSSSKSTSSSSLSPSQSSSPHWSTTEDGVLVAKITSFIYRKLLTPEIDGGMRGFIEDNCHLFQHFDPEKEHQLQYTEIFQEYEKRIEQFLEEFSQTQKLSSKQIMTRLQRAASDYPGASKNLDTLLAASDYPKFVKMMKRKAQECEPTTASQEKPRERNRIDYEEKICTMTMKSEEDEEDRYRKK